MAITKFGEVAIPVDGSSAANAGPTNTFANPPIASMTAGDLVIVTCQYRGTVTITNSATGGQTWTALQATIQSGNQSVRTFWCTFNGTWSAAPAFTNTTGTNALTTTMVVFRPTGTTYTWQFDTNFASFGGPYSAPSTPFTVLSGTSNSPTKYPGVCWTVWTSDDDNTWGTLTGSGWTAMTSAQYRNTTGQDQSMSMSYNIFTSGTVANVSQNQATLGGDPGILDGGQWYEIAPVNNTFRPGAMFNVF